MHFSEFLAQETLQELGRHAAAACFGHSPGHSHRPQLETGVLQLLLRFPSNFSALWTIVSIPEFKQLNFPAGCPYGGEWDCEILAWPVVPACLSFSDGEYFPPGTQHQGLKQ